MDVMRAEAEVSQPRPGFDSGQDQSAAPGIADEECDHQEASMIPVLESMPVVPTDRMETRRTASRTRVDRRILIAAGLKDRPELRESDIDLMNRQISRQAARNALLAVALAGWFLWRNGTGGPLNPYYYTRNSTDAFPPILGEHSQNAFNNSVSRLLCRTQPEYSASESGRQSRPVSFRAGIPAGQLAQEQLKKQIRIEVRNAQYALEQTSARVQAARKARDLAQRTFDITKKEQDLGRVRRYQTLTAQRDLAVAELDLVNANDRLSKSRKSNWNDPPARLWNIMASSFRMPSDGTAR